MNLSNSHRNNTPDSNAVRTAVLSDSQNESVHDCTAGAEVTHVRLHVTTLLSSTTHDDTPDPTTKQEPEQPPLEELTITWTPTHGPTRRVTFEHTATGWQHNNTTTTDTPSHTTVGEPASPPTLELIATTEEGHHE